MKKLLSVIAIGCCFVLPASGTCAEGGYEANAGIFVGGKFLNSDWDEIDKHGAYGLLYDIKQPEWPVAMALDLFYSKESDNNAGIKLEGETMEIHAGIRQYFNKSSQFQPYLGVGAAYITADVEKVELGVQETDDDYALGVWFQGGVKWMAGEHFNVGLDLQYTRAEATLFNEDVEVGGVLAGMTLGWRW